MMDGLTEVSPAAILIVILRNYRYCLPYRHI